MRLWLQRRRLPASYFRAARAVLHASHPACCAVCGLLFGTCHGAWACSWPRATLRRSTGLRSTLPSSPAPPKCATAPPNPPTQLTAAHRILRRSAFPATARGAQRTAAAAWPGLAWLHGPARHRRPCGLHARGPCAMPRGSRRVASAATCRVGCHVSRPPPRVASAATCRIVRRSSQLIDAFVNVPKEFWVFISLQDALLRLPDAHPRAPAASCAAG